MLSKKTVVLIDEGHFFPDLVEAVSRLLVEQVTVVVAGIDLGM